MSARLAPILRWAGLGLAGVVLVAGPFFGGLFFWRELLAAQAAVFVAFALWAAGRLLAGDSLDIPGGWVGGGLPALAACYALLLPFAAYPRGDLDWLLRVLAAWLLYLMARQEGSPLVRRAFAWLLVLGATAVAGVGLLEFSGFFRTHSALGKSLSLVNLGDRLYASFQYPNAAAAFLILSLVVAVGLAAEARRPAACAVLAAAGNLLLIAFCFAVSRGALVVLPIGLVALFLGLPRGSRWPAALLLLTALVPALVALRGVGANSAIENYISAWRWIGASAVAAAAVGALIPVYLRLPVRRQRALAAVALLLAGSGALAWRGHLSVPAAMARLKDINMQTVNARLRLIYDADALRIVRDHPLGLGGAGWNRTYRQYQQFNYIARETHDHYAQTAVEAGVPGLLALVVSLVAALWLGWRQRQSSPLAWSLTAAVVTLAAHAAIDFDLSYGALWFLLWTLAGLGGSRTEVPVRRPAPSLAVAGASLALGALCVPLFLAAHLNARGASLLGAHREQQAVPLLEHAARLDPWDSDIATNLGQAYLAVRDPERATLQYQRAVRRDRFHAVASYKLADVLAARGQFEPALAAARLSLTDQPQHVAHYEQTSDLLDTLLSARLAEGRRDQALALARELVALGDRLELTRQRAQHLQQLWPMPPLELSPTLYLHLGKALWLTGDTRRAQDYLEKAQRTNLLAIQADPWLYALYERTGQRAKLPPLDDRPWIRFRQSNPVYRTLQGW